MEIETLTNAKGPTEYFDALKGQMKKKMVRIALTEIELGLYDTSPKPCGKYKHFWVMRLRRLSGRHRLPRGFCNKPQYV